MVVALNYAVLLVGDLPPLDEALAGVPAGFVPLPDCEAAISRLALQQFHLVICDYPSLAPIRAAQPSIPIIVLGTDLPNEAVIAVLEQAFAYIPAPLELSTLKNLVVEALENPDQPDSIQIQSHSPNFIMLRLRCTFATASRLIRGAMQLKSDVPQEDRDHAAIAFRELLLNAIEHGGKLDPDRWVTVCRVRSKRSIIYHIQDPGEGFSRSGLKHAAIANPDASPIEHMHYREQMGMRSGGFGILMAQKLVDEIIYNESGNGVVLIKHLA